MAVELNATNVADTYATTAQENLSTPGRTEPPSQAPPTAEEEGNVSPAVVTELSAQALEASRAANPVQDTTESAPTPAVETLEPVLNPLAEQPVQNSVETSQRSQIDKLV